MIRTLILLLIFSFASTNAQNLDSINTKVKIFPDTTFIQPDSLLLSDSLLTIVKPDSIVPIYSQALTEKSIILRNDELVKLEYQYIGNYFKLFPFNFIKDLAFTGQPNETFLYGVGNNAISYLIDGVSFNDRYSNSLNLNLIQTEDIDSIEIVPLPRGFLYGAYNNPVSVNFITKDFISIQPYSRIRFYQGANRDMMLDGSFNAILMKKLIGSFDVTNRIFDGTYDNTDYSIWQGKVKLKYLLSNDVNIIASYTYNDYKAGYSGGVNVDTIIALGENVNDVLYDFRAAPMLYPDGELKTLTHFPRLRFLIKLSEKVKTDLSIFYLYNDYQKISQSKQQSENKIFGVNFKNDINCDPLNFQLIADYEKGKVNRWEEKIIDSLIYQANIPTLNYDLISVSGNVSLKLFNGAIITSAFSKFSSYSTSTGSRDFSDQPLGVGFDITYKATKFAAMYLGYSIPKSYSNYENSDNLLEIGGRFNFDFIQANIKYFRNNHKTSNTDFSGTYNTKDFGNLSGIGLSFDLKYSTFLLQSISSYYTSLDDEYLFGVPKYQTQTALYYKGKLFNDNLDLKTGFIFYYTGNNNVHTRENGLIEVPSSNKLDFTLAGEIQKTAIVYFTWQNLLDNQYYLTPYYPMPSRSVRFGVAWKMFN